MLNKVVIACFALVLLAVPAQAATVTLELTGSGTFDYQSLPLYETESLTFENLIHSATFEYNDQFAITFFSADSTIGFGFGTFIDPNYYPGSMYDPLTGAIFISMMPYPGILLSGGHFEFYVVSGGHNTYLHEIGTYRILSQVPVPASLFLLGSALGLLIWRRTS